MYTKIITLVLLGLLFAACNQERNIEIDSESLTENDLEICQNTKCPEITINFLSVQGDGVVSKKINSKIRNFIISSLEVGEDENERANTINEAATNFIESYNDDKSRFPDMAADYFAEISVTELYISARHICFEMRQYLYTGGAHGYGTTSFINIDPKTGNQLTDDDLFKNKKDFIAFAEQKFREQQKIDENQSINASGFWFEDDNFYLPESVGFTHDTLIFVYNQYDIASYAEGPIELKISLNEAEPFLKID